MTIEFPSFVKAEMSLPRRKPEPTISQRVRTKFRALDKYDLNVVDSRSKGLSLGRKVEFYPPDERDNPNPGMATVEVFDPSFRGADLENIIAADFLHYIGKVDPVVSNLRSAFAQSITPEQMQIDMRAYQRARNGEFGERETRSFDEWYETHRLDQYLGAMFLPKGSPERREWLSGMTDDQRRILARIEQYMRTGR